MKHLVTFLLLLLSVAFLKAQTTPFSVAPDLFDQSEEDSLGLAAAPGTETITIFAPSDSTDKYSNGVVMTAFNGYLYCQWQSSAVDEDASDTWVAYSRSEDGITWSAPMVLAQTLDSGYCSSGGWWVNGDTLVAYLNTWPASVSPRGGYTRYTVSTDGLTWSAPQPVLMADGDTLMGIFEQDPHALPDGRIINAAHLQPGLVVSPIYTDDPSGVSGWIKADMTNNSVSSNVSRELEPSWYLRSDSVIVMTFRDQNSSYKRLASISADRGETWTRPTLTNMPDSRFKQSAGNLPDGAAFLVGNPKTFKTRIPLAVTLSPDGQYFNTAYLLRKGGEGIQPLRYEGLYKRLGYHYPKSLVYDGHLYVSYSTNKEDVEMTRVPIENLEIDTTTSGIFAPLADPGIHIPPQENGSVQVRLEHPPYVGLVRILTTSGQTIQQEEFHSGEFTLDMNAHSTGIYLIQVITLEGSKTIKYQDRN